MPAWLRRSISIPCMLLVAVLLLLGIWLWLPLAWLTGRLAPRWRGLWRCLLFLTVYTWGECAGILAALWLWLRYGIKARPGTDRHARFVAANYGLQRWWAAMLVRYGARLFRLRFHIEGQELLQGGGLIWMPRHASIGDTVLPMVFYCIPFQKRLHYVLKDELLWDPCLDIVGNRLPNCFVSRSGKESAMEVAKVTALLADLKADESVLIYPEGTRFDAAKRQRILVSLQMQGKLSLAVRGHAWEYVLPPRFGGPIGILGASTGRDILFCAHSGLEGSSSLLSLANDSWTGSWIHIRFWRESVHSVPADRAGQEEWLLAQWARMNQTVAELHRARMMR